MLMNWAWDQTQKFSSEGPKYFDMIKDPQKSSSKVAFSSNSNVLMWTKYNLQVWNVARVFSRAHKLKVARAITSIKSFLASSTPATSSKVIPVLGSIWNLALDFPNCMGLFPPGPPPIPPCPPDWRESKKSPPTKRRGNARLPIPKSHVFRILADWAQGSVPPNAKKVDSRFPCKVCYLLL